MERKQFFILEKDFLNTREVGDLIEALGLGGVGAYNGNSDLLASSACLYDVLQTYLLSTSLAWSVRKKWRSENKGLRLPEIWSLTVSEV